MTKNAIKEKQGLVNIANEEWPALSEISAGRFKINKKSQVTDIDALTKNLQAVSEKDDQIIQSSLKEDEALLSKVTVNKSSKTSRAKKTTKVVTPEVQATIQSKVETLKVEQPTQQTVKINGVEQEVEQEEVVSVVSNTPKVGSTLGRTIAGTINTTGKILTQVKEPVKQEIKEENASLLAETQPITQVTAPASTRYATSTPVEKESKISPNVLMKFIAMGFAHLYMKKTTSVLKPLSFVADNFNKVFMALLHLGVPLMMTWFLMTKVDFIASQMAKEHQIMHFGYSVVFYIACLFVWISAQVLGSGLMNMFKKTLVDVAKVGKENR